MKKLMAFLTSVALLFTCNCVLLAQNSVSVMGTVLDESGMPLIGASVIEKGNPSNGTITDADGRFSISAAKGSTLEVAYLSYETKMVTAVKNDNLVIVLKEDTNFLDEIVVVGYGSQSRRSLVSSISTVKSDIIGGQTVTATADVLKGRVTGLYAASNDQTPGEAPRMLIRGGSSINLSNEPVVIVDGIQRGMQDLDVNDIESVEVLKDAASASIYGARASNGVILVTTKKGKSSKSPQLTFEATVGVQSPVSKWNLMNATEFLNYVRPQLESSGQNKILTGTAAAGTGNTSASAPWSTRYLKDGESVPEGWLSMADPIDPTKTLIYQDYDSQSRWFSNNALWQKYYIGINGGSDKVNYLASVNYTKDDGVVRMTSYDKLTLHTNTTYKVSDNLEVSTTMDFTRRNNDQMYDSNWNVLGRGIIMGPTRRNILDDGRYSNGSGWFQDPDYWEKAYDYENSQDDFAGNISATWTILDGLQAIAKYGTFSQNQIYSMYEKYMVDGVKNYRGVNQGCQEKRWNNIRDTFTAYLTYNHTFAGKHNMSIMGGYDYSMRRNRYLYAKSTGQTSDKVPILASGTTFTASNTDTKESLVSYFARANYDYSGKYLFGLTARADGSSKFAPGHKWGFFPAASAGWIISDENFFSKASKTVNFLKLRASYGYTGNNGIDLYDAFGAYSTSSLYNGASVTLPSSMQNVDLTWETTAQLDLGFDVNFLKDRIRITADYYNKVTSNMLFDVTLPDTGSFDSVMANVGSARFYGFELALHTVNIDKKDLYWSTDINWSFNRNRVLSLDDSYKYIDINGNEAWRIGGYTCTQSGERFGGIAVGERLGRIYGFVIDKIITTKEEADNALYDALSKGYRREDNKSVMGRKAVGDYEWVNRPGTSLTATGEEQIDNEDVFELGNVLPSHTGSINNTIKFKRFTFNLYMDFALGHSIINYFKARTFMNTYGNCNGNITRDVYDCWEPGKTDYKYARFLPNDCDFGNSNFQRNSDFCIEKADYLCIRDVSISYDLPEKWLKSLKIKKMSIGASGNTLAYIDNVTGTVSPEIGIATGSGSWFEAARTSESANSNFAPAARKILFNVKISF